MGAGKAWGEEELTISYRAYHKASDCVDGVGKKEEVFHADVIECFTTILLAARGSSSEGEASPVRNNHSGSSICVKVKEMRNKCIKIQGYIDKIVKSELTGEAGKDKLFSGALDLLNKEVRITRECYSHFICNGEAEKKPKTKFSYKAQFKYFESRIQLRSISAVRSRENSTTALLQFIPSKIPEIYLTETGIGSAEGAGNGVSGNRSEGRDTHEVKVPLRSK